MKQSAWAPTQRSTLTPRSYLKLCSPQSRPSKYLYSCISCPLCHVALSNNPALHVEIVTETHRYLLTTWTPSIAACVSYSSNACCRCNAVHPGYGFLSESAEFVDMCEEAGIAFLGPRADTMRLFSRKHDARAFAENAKVPILAGKCSADTLMYRQT